MTDPHLTSTIKTLVAPHLPDNSYSVVMFGSWVKGKNRVFSDVDIGIIGPKPLSGKVYSDIIDAFEQSDLPYRVDIVDFSCVSDRVKKNALSYALPL